MRQTSTSKPTSTQHPSIGQSVNRSISQPVRQSVSQSVSQSLNHTQSRQIESYRVGCRLSPPRSAPQPQVSTRRPGPPIAASPCCCPCALLRCAVVFAWASGDGPELDEHAPCGRSLGLSEAEEDYSPVLRLMNWLSGGETTGNCCMRQEDKV